MAALVGATLLRCARVCSSVWVRQASRSSLVGFASLGGVAALASHIAAELDTDRVPNVAPAYPLPLTPADCRFFCQHRRGDHRGFSNWFDESVLPARGHWSPSGAWTWCSEISFILAKAHYFGATEAVKRLEQLESNQDPLVAKQRAAEAKHIGRTMIPTFDAAEWDRVSFYFMVKALLRKFRQHDELRAELLATEGLYLAEAAHYDSVWGIGLRAVAEDDKPGAVCRDACGALGWATPPAAWPTDGNRLGRALMLVREILLTEDFVVALAIGP